jgi:hypothetical protein
MPPELMRPQTPSELAGSGEPADGRLLQDRLRLFGGITFLIAAAFYAVGLVLGGLGIQSAFDAVARGSTAAARRGRAARSGRWMPS